ncbi:hypothetical protein V1477_007142 [Vespula maculifrons]|uniref:Uncharacterized protein n=1 Tax=Vespula maculifrons TaxID=7453 RepID=A0ABD2CHQ9_VESMC
MRSGDTLPPVTTTNSLLVQLCVGLRPVNLEIFTDDIRVRINEQVIQIYNSLFDFRLKCDVGLLVQLCFELRGVDLEIFADDIRVNLNTKWGYTPTRDDNKLCFELRGVDLEIFADDIRVSINEELIQIYNSPFDFRLKCDVGLCFQLRRVDLEIFTRARDFHNLSPRVDLEIFTDAIRVSINERLKNDVGLLVQLCVGLRPVNLEIFTDDIRVNLNAKWGYTPTRDDNKVGSLTDAYSYSFSCALNFEEWT